MAQTIVVNKQNYEAKGIRSPLASDPTQMVTYYDTAEGTATPAQVLDGVLFFNKDGKQEGAMPNNGDVTEKLDGSNTSAVIPAGYTSGGTVSIETQTKSVTPTKSAQSIVPDAGKVLTQVSLAAIPAQYIQTTDATAGAEQIVSGYSAYVNGKKVEGTHTDATFTLEDGILIIR